MPNERDKPDPGLWLARSHIATFLFLMPFLAMLGIHRLLGLSDDLMGRSADPQRAGGTASFLYNVAMVAVFYGGAFGFFCHATSLTYRGWWWLAFTLVFLAVFWTVLLAMLGD